MNEIEVEITKLSPAPGDLIVLTARGLLTAEQVQDIREIWDTRIKPLLHPEVRLLITDQGMTIEHVDEVTLQRVGLRRA